MTASDSKEAAADDSSEILPWDSIQYFLTLARKGTLGRAAQRLGVSHTTVLRRIASLERELDLKLFVRTPAGFSLTDAGKLILERSEGMEQIAGEIFRVGGATDQLAGPVRLASMEGLAARVLVPEVARFSHENPQIEVQVVSMTHPANLNLREVDIVIGPTPHKGARVTSRLLASCEVRLYAARSYVEEFGAPSSQEDLAEHHFIDYVDDLIEFPELRWLRETIGRRNVRFRSTSPNVQLAATTRGMGIGMFPEYMVRDEPEIVPILADTLSTTRAYWIAMHTNLWRVPRMQAIAHFLNRELPARLAPLR